MINIRDCLRELGIDAKKVTYLGNYVVVDSLNDKYLIKKKDSNKEELFNYLRLLRII